MSLKKIQKDFLNKILQPPKSLSLGMKVYAEAYEIRLLSFLSDDFVLTKSLLGTKPFLNLCKVFIFKNPPHTHDLLEYSEAFVQFVIHQKKNPRNCPVWLPSLIQLELKLNQLIHISIRKFDRNELNSSKSPSSLTTNTKISLVPNAVLYESPYDFTPSLIAKKRKVIRKKKTHYLLHSANKTSQWEEISKTQYLLLKNMKKPTAIRNLIKKARPQAKTPLAKWFQIWMQAGLIKIRDPKSTQLQ